MRDRPTASIEQHRVRTGPLATTEADGANGAFLLPGWTRELRVIISDGSGWHDAGLPGEPWEHVSVSCEDSPPTWEEMEHIKRLFWRDDETVLQLDVRREDNPNCLHLWKPKKSTIPTPPVECV